MKCPKCKADNPDDSQFCRKCATPLTKIPGTLTSPPPEKEKEEKDEKSALDFDPGQYFGKRYQIIEEIGRGGMGRVYKALDKELNRTVALKMIKPEISSHPGIVERFKKEIKLASQITHENVCRIHDLGEVKGIKYISMEFIEGQNLHDFIQAAKRLNIDNAINITEQICQALTAAHKKGIIHRDLKPQNIMLDSRGNAYVMDFGIARSLEAEEVTKPGVVIGTPHYMSPEQGEGKGADARSDIYALGCIMYEMLTGKQPFEADTSAALIHKHITEVPKAPSQVNSQIPEGLEKIVLKCLEKKPEKRFQSADEIMRAIDEAKAEAISSAKAAKIPWRIIAPLAAMILIGIAIGFYYFIIKEKPPIPPPQPEWKNSIAVLSFTDMSPKKDQEYFCDGLAETLINTLTKVKDLQVIARTSAFSFKGKEVDIREIGEKLSVQTVLEGSVQKADNRLRITAQLINVADGSHLWSERFDREMDDIFAIQDEISQAIVSELRIKLTDEDRTLLTKRYTDNLEAYNLYLKGRYYWNIRTLDGMLKAIDYFQQAIEKDSTYALAYAGIAECYIPMGIYYLSPNEAFPKAKAAAEKALQIDDTLAEAHNSMAGVMMTYDWDWLPGEKECKRAIELNPSYATAHHWYSLYLGGMGRHEESIAEAKRAQELDPLSLIISTDFGLSLYAARQYNQAIEQLQSTLRMDPNFIIAHYYLSLVYAQKRMHKEAIEEALKAIDLSGGENTLFVGRLGYIYSMSGNKKKALEVLDELQELSKQRYVSPVQIALIYGSLGQNDHAFEWLEKAYEERDSWMIYLKVEPSFDNLRSDPRFKALLKKMNLE